MGNSEETRKQLESIAAFTVNIFSKVSEAAASRIERRTSTANPEVFANINTHTSTKAVRNLDRIHRKNEEGLRILTKEPAIARIVVLDEKNKERVYYICRPVPEIIPSEDVKFASYRSPIGRLAALPIGENLTIKEETFEVVEKAELHPRQEGQEWDSLNSILEGRDYEVVTIDSFQALLKHDSLDGDKESLDRLLEEENIHANIQKGLRRRIITKMELRDQPILDRYQDEIFRLPIDSRLLLLGAPGTGKTTTLIRRLGQKLDLDALEEDEWKVLSNIPNPDNSSSWIMFTPTELLKQYVKEAFAREGIPAPDERIKTWADYRWELARETFGILKSESGRGSYIMKETAKTIASETLSDQRAWFTDFDQWQKALFWDEMRAAANSLRDNEIEEVSNLGRRTLMIIGGEGVELSSGKVIQLTDIVVEVRNRIANMK